MRVWGCLTQFFKAAVLSILLYRCTTWTSKIAYGSGSAPTEKYTDPLVDIPLGVLVNLIVHFPQKKNFDNSLLNLGDNKRLCQKI